MSLYASWEGERERLPPRPRPRELRDPLPEAVMEYVRVRAAQLLDQTSDEDAEWAWTQAEAEYRAATWFKPRTASV